MMKIVRANSSDAPIIHDIMVRAFKVFEYATPPTSALKETVSSITTALEHEEQAFIAYLQNEAVGMVRFRIDENELFFYRLATLPEFQGKGVAKKILHHIESYAIQHNIRRIQCHVRKNVAKNIALYHALGYQIEEEKTMKHSEHTSIDIVSMVKII